jgi:hypothetical protein
MRTETIVALKYFANLDVFIAFFMNRNKVILNKVLIGSHKPK